MASGEQTIVMSPDTYDELRSKPYDQLSCKAKTYWGLLGRPDQLAEWQHFGGRFPTYDEIKHKWLTADWSGWPQYSINP